MTHDYGKRRQALAKQLPDHSVAVIPAGKEMLRNGDADYRFRQNSDFYYLTGFNEPEAVLLIFSNPTNQSVLFTRPRNPNEEQWQGKRLGPEAACATLGVDLAFSIDDLATQLPQFLLDKQTLVYAIGQEWAWDKRLLDALAQSKKHLRAGYSVPGTLMDISSLLGELRLLKSATEIECMREAAKITVAAHQRAMQACKQARYEYELEAELIYEFTRRGCRAPAYDSIVAAGNHACILHYTANDGLLQQGDLVLIDAGAEFQCYAADVTRTFPISGQYSAEQRAIYELVLTAQQTAIAMIQPGLAWNDMQKNIINILTQGLIDLKILKGSLADLIETQAYKPFYMHNSGHWLGLDVHDCGRYRLDGQWRSLSPGMVLTVEPGIYISPGMEKVDPRWWGIGVRIEDDILVTEQGHDNLTGALQTHPTDIEALLRG